MPYQRERHSGTIIAVPAMAASRWSQIDCGSVMSAMASIGSKAVVLVVPEVATTAHGTRPAARSRATASPRAAARMARAGPVGAAPRPGGRAGLRDGAGDRVEWVEEGWSAPGRQPRRCELGELLSRAD